MVVNVHGSSARADLWAQGQDVSVQVNQRALIDKILARYSGEYTIFRELLQNADDAGAQSVRIRFYTAAGLSGVPRTAAPDLKNEPIIRNVFLNDGMAFRPEDWSRLREIAAGNPSDDKIGAFGVGFYSLFSITESPLVESGDQWMGFYWKDGGDQLFARSGRLDHVAPPSGSTSDPTSSLPTNEFRSQTEREEGPTMSGHPWTKFTMDVRSPIALEGPLDFARFLVTSLTFMKSMRKVEMWVDDWRLLEITKDVGVTEEVDISGFRGERRPAGRSQAQSGTTQQHGVPGGYLSRLAAAGKQYGRMQAEPDLDGTTSPGGVMRVQSVDCTNVKISAKVMRLLSEIGLTPPPLPTAKPIASSHALTSGSTFGSMITSALFGRSSTLSQSAKPELPKSTPVPEKPKDPTTLFVVSMSLKIFGADVQVYVDEALGKELERATKKAPPKRTNLSLIYSAGEEHAEPGGTDPVSGGSVEGEAIFAGLKPELDGNERTARIFIGQATGQTTGIAGHIAARFIPTVERESIDLQDRHVSVWNKELLYVGGYLARVIYEVELQEIIRIWDSSVGPNGSGEPDDAVRKWLTARGLHALRFFTYYASTPSPTVGRTMEAAWHGSLGESAVPIVSTDGVRAAKTVRMPEPTLLQFLPNLPVLPETYPLRAEVMIGRLRERGMLADISLDDVIDELGRTPLGETSMVACLRWWQGIATLKEYKASLRTRLLDAAILSMPDPAKPEQDVIYPLTQITTYLNASIIPSDVPLPPTTIPYAISKQLKSNELQFNFDWSELSLHDWLGYLLSPEMSGESAKSETNVLKSSEFAEKVVGIIGRAWQKVSAAEKTALADVANREAWLPTREGPRVPKEAYFADVDLFPDLPIVTLPTSQIKGNLRAFLSASGVRSHVELQLVFSRLVGSSKWSCFQLIAYLVKARSTLSDLEIARLKKTAAFPVEDGERNEALLKDQSSKATKRVTPDMLYEPTEEHRKLGLDVLDWGAGWKPPSEEAKFMFMLGLRRHPVLTTLLKIAATETSVDCRTTAFDYLVKNIAFYNGFNAAQYGEYKFVPAMSPTGHNIMASPKEAFLNPSSSLMGFATVVPLAGDAAAKLRLIKDVPTEDLVRALVQRPPGDVETAKKQYEYLQTRLPDFWKEGTLPKLASVAFIRTANERTGAATGSTVLLRPTEVFFRPNSESASEVYEMYKSFFHFVDFGKQGNAFLEQCGVMLNPSVDQLANLIIQDPRKFLRLAGTHSRYLAQLRLLSANFSSMPSSTKRAMTNAPFLLAGTRVSVDAVAKANGRLPDDDHEDGYTLEYDLAKAAEICIVDEVQAYNLFSTEVKAAPQEEVLEDFYEKLGAKRLSALVKEETKLSGTPKSNQPHALRLRSLILERLALFFSDRNRSASDVSLDWLRKEGHLMVFTANSIHVRRTYRQGQVESTNSQAISAAVVKGRGQVVNMYISEAMEIDMFEVAFALAKALFKRVRPDEPLLLMTILTTPLSSLKRRGYNVDRILNQQKAERLVREAHAREEEEAERKRQNEKFPPAEKAAAIESLKKMFPHEDTGYLRSLLEAQDEDHLMNATETLLERNATITTRPTPSGNSVDTSADGKGTGRKRTSSIGSNSSKMTTSSLMGNLRQKFRASSAAQAASDRTGLVGGEGAQRSSSAQGTESGWDGVQRTGAQLRRPPSAAPNSHVTPYSSIKENALRAVAASRSDTSREIASQPQRKVVKESEGAYCDTTSNGVLTDLVARGSVGGTGVKLLVSRDVTDPDSLIKLHRTALLRFAERIIVPLAQVFKLEPGSCSIFHDSVGPLIAFNRAGALYFNARYYIAWHDVQVQNDDLTDPLISWYFTAAHEAAHNIVSDHNSEHEFYFSSIAETFMMELTQLIQRGT